MFNMDNSFDKAIPSMQLITNLSGSESRIFQPLVLRLFFNSYIFCLIVIILFFKMLYIINGGVINIYFLLITILSFFLFYKKFTNIMSK